MKQEITDIVVEVIRSAPATVATFLTWDMMITILTGIYITLQIAYLVRKWWREETAWGLRIKRWAKGDHTQPGDL